MHLTEIAIQGYKSLWDVRLKDLPRLACLVGRNSAGKSAVLEVLWSLSTLGTAEQPWEDSEQRLSNQWAGGFMCVKLTARLEDVERRRLTELLLSGVQESGRPIDANEKHELLHQGFATSLRLEAALYAVRDAAWRLNIWTPYFVSAAAPAGRDDWILAELGRPSLNPTSPNDRLALPTPVSLALEIRSRGPIERQQSDVPPYLAFEMYRNNPRNSLAWVPTVRTLGSAIIFISSHRRPPDEGDTSVAVRELAADATNLPQVLHTSLSGDYDRFKVVVERVREIFPELQSIQTPLHPQKEHRITVTTRWTGRSFDEPLSQGGAGVAQALVAALLATEATEERIVLFEEPELHMHPAAQSAIVRLLRDVSKRNQVIITTQSPQIAGLLDPSEVFLLRLQEGKTSVSRGTEASTLREIAHDLGIRLHEGLLSPLVVLVDGTSDARILSAWYETLHAAGVLRRSLDQAGIGLVPLYGETNFAYFMETGSLERLTIRFALIQDRDAPGHDAFKSRAEEWVCARGGEIWRWRKRTIENYFHPNAIERVLGTAVGPIHADADVKDVLTRALKARHAHAEYLPDRHGPEIARAMTPTEIEQWDLYEGGRHEVIELLKRLSEPAQPAGPRSA